jgi:hypothetical protein
MGEPTARRDELIGRSLLDDSALIHHDRVVRVLDHGVAVGDDQRRWPVGEAAERLLEFLFGGVVEIGGGFVQDQDARPIDQDARDLQALPFSHRQAHAALTDFRGQALGQAVEEIPQARGDGGVANFLAGGTGPFVAHVFGQRSAENRAIGGNHSNGAADRRRVQLGEALSVNPDLAGIGLPEFEEQVGGGGFSGAGWPDNGGNLTSFGGERNAAQHLPLRPVAESDLAKLDFAGAGLDLLFRTTITARALPRRYIVVEGSGTETTELTDTPPF